MQWFLSDKNGHVLQANEAYCILYGYPREAVVGRPFYIIFPPDHHEWAMAEYKRVFADPQTPNHFESTVQRADGSERTLDTRIGFIEHKGERLAMLSTIRDITDCTQTEQQLRQHIEFIDGLTTAMPGLVFVFDVQRLVVTYLNQTVESFLGYSVELSPALNLEFVLQAIHPDDVTIVMANIQQIAEADEHTVLDCIFRLRQANGRYQYMQSWQRILNRDANGLPQEIIGCLYNITAQKEMEAVLHERDQLINSVAEASPAVLYIYSLAQQRNIYANREVGQVLGYSPEELKQMGNRFLADLMHPQDWEGVADHLEKLSQYLPNQVIEHEYRMRHKNGEWRWLLGRELVLKRHEDGSIDQIVGIAQDITERKTAEHLLRQSEEQFRTIFTHSGLGIVIGGNDGRLLQTNPMFCQMIGYSEKELANETYVSLSHPEDAVKELQYLAPLKSGQIDSYQLEKRYRHKAGHYIWVLLTVAVVRNNDGTIKYFIGQAQDITTNKESEKELRKLSHVVEQSPVSVMVTNTNVEIEYVNPRFTQVTGYTLAEVRGKNPNILKSNKTPESTYQQMWQTLKAGQVWRGEFLNKKKSNELFWEEVSISPVLNDQGESSHYVAIKEDITERKLLEKQARYQERLASVGQLAAGIAHDFNNILAVIMLYSQLMQTAENLDSRHKSRLDIIVQQAIRASELIQQILDFSRQAILEKRPLDMVAVTQEMVRMLTRTMPENIVLKIDHDAELYTVNADPTRIQQILMNLCVNARDAMPLGGLLTIELSHLLVEAGRERPLTEMDNGSWVCIKISDTGIGIAEENLTHIFDPFFTTKQPGHGTGLGLAQVYGIVKQHDGHIRVDSVVGQGTHFFIYFPALFYSSMIQLNASINTLHSGSGQTILIVEDERIMRQTLSDILLKLGYKTIMAKDGAEALETLAQVKDVDLILSDMVMPRMGGAELLQNLNQQQISLPVIILSGYAFHEDMRQLRHLGMKGWLSKPPDLEQLAQLIHAALVSGQQ
jgi:two-component system, cell cycle sensor histidine kinase and response regulator CckA